MYKALLFLIACTIAACLYAIISISYGILIAAQANPENTPDIWTAISNNFSAAPFYWQLLRLVVGNLVFVLLLLLIFRLLLLVTPGSMVESKLLLSLYSVLAFVLVLIPFTMYLTIQHRLQQLGVNWYDFQGTIKVAHTLKTYFLSKSFYTIDLLAFGVSLGIQMILIFGLYYVFKRLFIVKVAIRKAAT